MQQVWSEIQCLPFVPSEDICDTMSVILEKDLAETENSWIDHKTKLSGVVLDIERMVFKEKDLHYQDIQHKYEIQSIKVAHTITKIFFPGDKWVSTGMDDIH